MISRNSGHLGTISTRKSRAASSLFRRNPQIACSTHVLRAIHASDRKRLHCPRSCLSLRSPSGQNQL